MNHLIAFANVMKKYNINNDIFNIIYSEYLNLNSNIIINRWYHYIYKTDILTTNFMLDLIYNINFYNNISLFKIKYIHKYLRIESLNGFNIFWWLRKINNLFINIEVFEITYMEDVATGAPKKWHEEWEKYIEFKEKVNEIYNKILTYHGIILSRRRLV